MQQIQAPNQSVEWVRILKKGNITIPKKLREKAGIKSGDIARAWVSGRSIIIESREAVDELRIYTKEDLARWDEEDRLTPDLAEKYKDLLEDII